MIPQTSRVVPVKTETRASCRPVWGVGTTGVEHSAWAKVLSGQEWLGRGRGTKEVEDAAEVGVGEGVGVMCANGVGEGTLEEFVEEVVDPALVVLDFDVVDWVVDVEEDVGVGVGVGVGLWVERGVGVCVAHAVLCTP